MMKDAVVVRKRLITGVCVWSNAATDATSTNLHWNYEVRK